ncbi:MAG: TIGR04282 family arsenosugar biosynthesis glycosyltransferase [ANME-2 cluster archaeon]|nr:TIGR04282 family arsenosugar biosynthesis glycosyltransferase [ANME-2 cluster archaeon]
MSRDAVVVMAKAPEAFKVKTRLTPPLDPEIASHLYHCFLLDKLEQVRCLKDICPAVAYTPQDRADFFNDINPAGFTLIPQDGDDLGERLANISQYFFEQGYDKVVILDSDSPNLPREYIYNSVRILNRTDVVIGPCIDGGYYLIGLGKHIPELFLDIPWSTSKVMSSTMEKAVDRGITISLLDEWYDVDTWDDVLRLKHDMENPHNGSFLCENTYTMLSRILYGV